jgi:O-antigen ligase
MEICPAGVKLGLRADEDSEIGSIRIVDLSLSHQQLQNVVSFRPRSLQRPAFPIAGTGTVKGTIRYTFYAFTFSLPFEVAYAFSGSTMSKFLGIALAAFALLQPRLCYAFPPKAFWWFVGYLFVYVVWGAYLMLVPPIVPNFDRVLIESMFRLIQFLTLFWISSNLMKLEQVSTGALWALAGSITLLAIFQIVGLTGDAAAVDRAAAFDQNPNSFANVLAIGLLAVFGLGYGRAKSDWKGRVVFWLASGVIVLTLVQTGSRGAIVAVAGALSICFLKGRSLATKLKIGTIGLTGILALAIASYQIEAVRKRWETTFYDDNLSGRQEIYREAIGMILESPLIGWGPMNHHWELGPRVGLPYRDEHNTYLYLLAEGGLVGAIPFLAALWLCWRAAWRARHGMQGILPLVMLSFVLVLGLKGTTHKTKLFWLVLSYSLASSTYMVRSPRSKMEVASEYRVPAMRGRYKLSKVSRTARPPSRSSYPIRRG